MWVAVAGYSVGVVGGTLAATLVGILLAKAWLRGNGLVVLIHSAAAALLGIVVLFPYVLIRCWRLPRASSSQGWTYWEVAGMAAVAFGVLLFEIVELLHVAPFLDASRWLALLLVSVVPPIAVVEKFVRRPVA